MSDDNQEIRIPKHVEIFPGDIEDTTITTREALEVAHYYGRKVTVATLHNWICAKSNKRKLHHQPKGPGGRHFVFKLAFLRFIKGEEETCQK